jgi:hypothetical protein
MDSILKTNIRGYLIDMLEEKGYAIEYNDEIKDDLLDKKIVSKTEIKQHIVELLNLNKEKLNEFENDLVSNDKSLEKHFNLRIFLNDNIKDKLGESIEKNLFIESLKNKYSKISICKELMKVLNIGGFDGLNKDVVGRFEGMINSSWLKENINIIKGVFDIKTKKYNNFNYYNIYLLLITVIKNLFDTDLFTRIQIKKNTNKYIYYNFNKSVLLKHENVINQIDMDTLNINFL